MSRPSSNFYPFPSVYISKLIVRHSEFSDSLLVQAHSKNTSNLHSVKMAAPPHIQAAYARYARDYGRLPTVPSPRPEGWIDLSHVPVHREYATAVKKMLFEAHHAHLFGWKSAPITFAPLEIPGFHEVQFRQRDALHAQRGRLALLIPRPFTNVIRGSGE
jgi:hypothetical protein